MRIPLAGEIVTFRSGQYFVGGEEVAMLPSTKILVDIMVDDDEVPSTIPKAKRLHTGPDYTGPSVYKGHGFANRNGIGQGYLQRYENGQSFTIA